MSDQHNDPKKLLQDTIAQIDGFENLPVKELCRRLNEEPDYDNFRVLWREAVDPDEVNDAALAVYERMFPRAMPDTTYSPPPVSQFPMEGVPMKRLGYTPTIQQIAEALHPLDRLYRQSPLDLRPTGIVAAKQTGTTEPVAPVEETTSVVPEQAKPVAESSPAIPGSPTLPAKKSHSIREAIEAARAQFKAMHKYDRVQTKAIADELFVALIDHAPPVIAAAPNPARKLHEIVKSDNTIIGEKILSNAISSRTAPQANTLAVGGAIDRLVAILCPGSEQQAEIANYLMGVPWPERRKQGRPLIEYSVGHGLQLYDLLQLDRYQQRKTAKEYAPTLGLSESQLDNTRVGRRGVPGKMLLDAIAKKLGCEGEENLRHFRKFALGIDFSSATPAALRGAFDALLQRKRNVTSSFEQAVLYADFFNLLEQYHGLRDRKELAHAIHEHANADGRKTGFPEDTVYNTLSDMSISEKRRKAGTTEGKASEYRNTMDETVAEAVASFAFPSNEELQGQCVELLSAPPPWINVALKRKQITGAIPPNR